MELLILKIGKPRLVEAPAEIVRGGITSNVLVDESKSHISAEDAIEKIRNYSCENNFSLHDKNLGSWIDMKEGKITQEKYNEIRFTI